MWQELLHHLPDLASLQGEEVVLAQADAGDPTAGGREAWATQRGGYDHKTTAHVWGLEATGGPGRLWGCVGRGRAGTCVGRRDGEVATAVVGCGEHGPGQDTRGTWRGPWVETWRPWHSHGVWWDAAWPGHAWDMAWPTCGTMAHSQDTWRLQRPQHGRDLCGTVTWGTCGP